MTKEKPLYYATPTELAIATNLDVLAERLARAAEAAAEASLAMSKGEQNQAIGRIIGLERDLPDMVALYNAALVLHRNYR